MANDGHQRQFMSPTGTWDEWLLTRAPVEGASEFVARALSSGAAGIALLDFGAQPIRDGLRALFEQFEMDTDGQYIELRKPRTEAGHVSIQIVRADDRVRVLMGYDENDTWRGEPVGTDLPVEKAAALAELLLDAIKAIAWPDGEPDGE